MLPHRRTQVWGGFLAACALALVSGCGSGGLYPVEGEVRFKEDGKPLANALVVFELKTTNGEPPLQSARGTTDENGRFRLSTTKEGDGAPEGVNRVRIGPPPSGDIERPETIKRFIHPKHEKFETSELEFTVTRDRNQNKFIIQVEKYPQR